jgi:stromal membrane-associated protein
MTSRLEKERIKQIQDKCQDLLTQMLRDEDNKYCVDCDAKGPRWASWNLGIFLCIRCAGIHRNLGVHISKVKSVNLDTWTPEQVVSLQQMGNSRARAVYEANLPDSFRRPQTDCSLESFIRAKYEHKKYIAREWVPAPLPKVNWDKELDEEAERQRRRKKEGTKSASSQSQLPPVKKPEVVPQLPKPHSSVSPKPSRPITNNSATLDLLGLDAPTNSTNNTNGSNSGDDIFSSFLSATPAMASSSVTSTATNGISESSLSAAASKADEESFFNQPAPTTQEKSKMTKDSILALYGTPSSHPSVFGLSGGIYNQQQGLSQSLQGLGVGGFGGQNNFSNPQMNTVPSQMQMTNQMNLNPSHMGMGSNSLGNVMQMGGTNQMNGFSNNTMAMQTHMQSGVTPVGSQMLQMGQANVTTNNGWSGMLANQNIQPAPGSNPFFNLPAQAPTNSGSMSQLPQQMGQMSLSGLGKQAPASLPGQSLSSNLWQ